MDLKAPGSGEAARNRYANLDLLRATDQVKFVLADRADYDWARARIAEHDLANRCEVLVQPVHDMLPPDALAGWVLEDRLPVRFQLQLHKLLWGEARGR
jgi:7-carboxy-7-deazaguanine synthase